jgi:anti-sigma factor RsiW
VGSKMKNEHLSQDSLEAYVIGALDEVAATDVEAHVADCAACAARLQREAALEVAFASVVASPSKPTTVSPRVGSIPAIAGAALAMAAAMLLWLAPRGESTERASAPVDEAPAVNEVNADASAVTASLDLQADGSRLGVRD